MQLRAVGPWLWLDRRDIMKSGSMPFQARPLRGESYLEATLRSIVAPKLGICISGRRLDCVFILMKLLESAWKHATSALDSAVAGQTFRSAYSLLSPPVQ